MGGTVVPSSRTALLLIDVINLFDFPGGKAFAKRALPAARKIAGLRERAHRAGVPVLYVNDNFGHWRSDFKALVQLCSKAGMPGEVVATLLKPAPEDFFVLKPHLSGFHETPLAHLLMAGGVRTVVVTGFAADNCVFFTAADAHMRNYRLVVPRDCVESERDTERRHTLTRMKKLFKATVAPAAGVRLTR